MFDRKAYMKEYHKNQYKNNKDAIDNRNKEYYVQHKEEITQYKQKWYKENKKDIQMRQKEKYNYDDNRKYSLKAHYGLTPDDYTRLFEKQDGKCAICKTPQEKLSSRLHVDHDHKTGKIRGLLCQKCNHGLGQFNDNPKLLHMAIKYLK